MKFVVIFTLKVTTIIPGIHVECCTDLMIYEAHTITMNYVLVYKK